MAFSVARSIAPSLYAEPVLEAHRGEMADLMASWSATGSKKQKTYSHLNEQECPLWLQFSKCAGVSERIGRALRSDRNSVFVCCKETKGNQEIVQAMAAMTCKPDYIEIDYLVTNPWNIRAPVNDDEPHRVSGAASQLLCYIEEDARRREIPVVQLFPACGTEGFYLKNGFRYGDEDLMYKEVYKIEKVASSVLAA